MMSSFLSDRQEVKRILIKAINKAKILSRKWQDFCFVFFILQFSVFILQLL